MDLNMDAFKLMTHGAIFKTVFIVFMFPLLNSQKYKAGTKLLQTTK